jgi:hypothetical protein
MRDDRANERRLAFREIDVRVQKLFNDDGSRLVHVADIQISDDEAKEALADFARRKYALTDKHRLKVDLYVSDIWDHVAEIEVEIDAVDVETGARI